MQIRPRSPIGGSAPATPPRPEASTAPAPEAARASEATGLLDRARGLLQGAGSFLRHLLRPFGTWRNPDLPIPPDRGGLKVVSYNIEVGGKRLDLIARDLKAYDADVVTLQETSEESARALAKRLGYHVAYHHNPFHTYGGNAVLSRYPITEARHMDMVNPWGDRLRELWRKFREGDARLAPLDARHMLHATIRVGDRTVDVLTAHLTLFGAATNARQLNQMADLAASLEKQGHSVVMTGDFNTNFAMSDAGVADRPGRFDTPTDTAAEFRERYPGMTVGNNGHEADMAAMNRLRTSLNDFWAAESRSVSVDGELMTPEQIKAELATPPGSRDPERQRKLLRALDGVTISRAKRFDNIFSSKDTRITSAHIDQTTRASDHQPVMAEIRWD